jgi:ribosomal protein L10
MKAALSILTTKEAGFPAPTRKGNPDYHDATVQLGLQKLNLLGARVDGKVFDIAETKWVGSIEGGMDGLRSQLVMALQSMGSSITSTLEGAGKSLYFTMESRRSVLEDEQKGEGEKSESS